MLITTSEPVVPVLARLILYNREPGSPSPYGGRQCLWDSLVPGGDLRSPCRSQRVGVAPFWDGAPSRRDELCEDRGPLCTGAAKPTCSRYSWRGSRNFAASLSKVSAGIGAMHLIGCMCGPVEATMAHSGRKLNSESRYASRFSGKSDMPVSGIRVGAVIEL